MEHIATIKALSEDFKKKSKEIQTKIDQQTNALKAEKTVYDTQARLLDTMAKKLENPAAAPKTRAKRKPKE